MSCHSMGAYAYPSLQRSAHYANAAGAHAGCADCHLPREFVPKMLRKIEAAREVWGEIRGIIDTPEKYAAHQPGMAARERDRMIANDSRECRNCHATERMVLTSQSASGQKYHKTAAEAGITCIKCHAGLAHLPAAPAIDNSEGT